MRGLTVAVVSVSVRSALVLVLAAMASWSMLPVSAQESAEGVPEGQSQHQAIGLANQGNDQPNLLSAEAEAHSTSPPETEGLLLSELEQPATTVTDWIAQIEASIVQITGVRVETTDAGLQVILETAEGELSVAETRTVGNALIVDIENAAIAEEFSQTEPIEGIALVSVTSLPGDRVRVAITGTDAPPVAEVTATGLAVTLGEAVVGAEEEAIQVVVTGEQDEGYNSSSASVGARTDAPLRDIPFSIQVIPEQVLEDRQVRSITEGLENVAGVTSITNAADRRAFVTIRGFENFSGNLINGIPDPFISTNGGFVNAERLEVLRGPAAALYGEVGSLGGTINIVTRQPLSDPFYEVSATAGSFNDYQGIVDLSGPLNDSETLLYRLIGSYRNFDSYINFFEGSETFIAPSVAFRGTNTDFILEGDVNILDRPDGACPNLF